MTLTLRQVAVWLFAIVGACYLTSLSIPFHFDDSHSVESNLAIRSLANIPTFWTDTRTSSFIPENRVYRPLVYTFYSFCWFLGKGGTFPFHLMKLLMHVLVCLALYRIWSFFWSIPGWFPVKNTQIRLPGFSRDFPINPSMAAFLLAILFAVHPACSECVDYIAATTSLQCTMFYVWAYERYLSFRTSENKRDLGLSLFLYFCSVASKEEGITLPAMIALSEVFLSREWASQGWAQTSSFIKRAKIFSTKIALPAISQYWTYPVLGVILAVWIYVMHPVEGNESRGGATTLQYFTTQWRMYLWYMRLWFWPWDFNADDATTVFSKALSEPLVIQAAIGNLVLLLVGWLNRAKFPALLFGIIWFYVTISPASSVIKLAEASNEHRMYLAYIGFVGGTFTLILAAFSFFASEKARARLMGWSFAAVVIGLVIGTQSRNEVWGSDENLWQDTIAKNPTSGRAYNNLALVYMGRGQYDLAIENLKKCETYWNTYALCPLNRGISQLAVSHQLEDQGKKDEALAQRTEAVEALKRAYNLNPNNVHANYHMGEVEQGINKNYVKAIEYFEKAVTVTGGRYPGAEFRISECFLELHKTDEALRAIGRVIEVEPDNEEAWFAKAKIEFETNRMDDSVRSGERLVELNPGHIKGFYNLGLAQKARGKLADARVSFQRVVDLDPKSEQGWYELSAVAESLGDGPGAMAAAQQLVEIKPDNREFVKRRDQLRGRFGKGGHG